MEYNLDNRTDPVIMQKLIDKYPKLLTNVQCGVWFPVGWYSLLDRLCNYIMYQHNINNKRLPKVGQVKEKFGGLRFYIDNRVCKEIKTAISFAESLSNTTCEVCSSMNARKINSGWITTVCMTCESNPTKDLPDNMIASIDPPGAQKTVMEHLQEACNETK